MADNDFEKQANENVYNEMENDVFDLDAAGVTGENAADEGDVENEEDFFDEQFTGWKNDYVLAIPTNDQYIYKTLDERYDVIICEERLYPKDYEFETDEEFNIFATSGDGDVYGFIGGTGSFEDDVYPIGYVSKNGYAGRIADNLSDFFCLIVFYPFWEMLFECEPSEILEKSEKWKSEMKEHIVDCEEIEELLSEALGISDDGTEIKKLLENVMAEPPFEAYKIKRKKRIPYRRLGK